MEHSMIKVLHLDEITDKGFCIVTWAIYAATQLGWWWYACHTSKVEEEKLSLNHDQLENWMRQRGQNAETQIRTLSAAACTVTSQSVIASGASTYFTTKENPVKDAGWRPPFQGKSLDKGK